MKDRWKGLLFVTSLLLACAVAPLQAQEDEAKSSRHLVQELHPPQIVDYDLKRGVLFYLGGVAVRIDEMELRCDNLLVWFGSGAEKPKSDEEGRTKGLGGNGRFVKELYAEGTVYLQQGKHSLRASRIYLDLENNRGIVLDARAIYGFRHRNRDESLQVQASELRMVSAQRVQANHARLSNTRFAVPLFHLDVEQLDLLLADEKNQEQGNVFEGLRYASRGNVLSVSELPVLALPDFVGQSSQGRSARYVDSVGYQRTNRMGHEFHVRIGDDILRDDGSRWGHWSVLATWLSKRGWGGGFDLDYAVEDYEGRFLGRYQRDHAEDNPFGNPGTKNRGRIHWLHRHRLPEKVQLDLEFSLLSERGFFPVYYEREFKTRKPPENVIHLKKDWLRGQLSFLAQKRFNRFFTTTESLPELRYELVTQPLFDIADAPLYYTTTVRAGKKKYRPSTELGRGGHSSFRVDLDNLLEHPVELGPLTLTPFTGVRWSWYENDLARDDRHRFGWTYGATLSTQAWKVFDARNDTLQLDGLRHLIYPQITFRDTVGVEVQPDELAPFDSVESFRNLSVVEFQLRNILQTRRDLGDGLDVDTFADLDTRLAYYPNPSDNGGRSWGNLDVDLFLRFTRELQLATDFEIDWYGRGLDVFNTVFGYLPSRDLELAFGFRHHEEDYDAVFAQVQVRLEQKWMVTVASSYDFRGSRSLEHRLRFSRISEESVLEIELKADVAENDYGFGIAFTPRLFWNPRRGIRSLGRDPRLRFPQRDIGH